MTYLCKNREFWKFLEPIRAFYNQSVSKQIGMGIHIFALGAIHKGCPHIGRGGGGVSQSGQMRTGGGGVVSQMWTSAWKKIIATIFVKYLANYACVSHLLRGQPHLLECCYRNCLIGTHMCVHPVSE